MTPWDDFDSTFLWTFPGSLLPSASGIGMHQTMIAPPPGETYPIMIDAESTWRSIANPASIMWPGLLWAYRGNPRGVRTYRQPATAPGHGTARIGMRDLPGQAVRLTISGAPPAKPAMLMLGLSDTAHGALALPAPLGPLGLPSITLRTSVLERWIPDATAVADAELAEAIAAGRRRCRGVGHLALACCWWARARQSAASDCTRAAFSEIDGRARARRARRPRPAAGCGWCRSPAPSGRGRWSPSQCRCRGTEPRSTESRPSSPRRACERPRIEGSGRRRLMRQQKASLKINPNTGSTTSLEVRPHHRRAMCSATASSAAN